MFPSFRRCSRERTFRRSPLPLKRKSSHFTMSANGAEPATKKVGASPALAGQLSRPSCTRYGQFQKEVISSRKTALFRAGWVKDTYLIIIYFDLLTDPPRKAKTEAPKPPVSPRPARWLAPHSIVFDDDSCSRMSPRPNFRKRPRRRGLPSG